MKYEITSQVEILQRLVDSAGGPAEFSRKYSRDDADKPIDATYVSQILNGHRPFRDISRRNMAVRAGLPHDYFEHKTEGELSETPTVQQERQIYKIHGTVVAKIVDIVERLPEQWKIQALGAVKLIADQYAKENQNSRQRAGQ